MNEFIIKMVQREVPGITDALIENLVELGFEIIMHEDGGVSFYRDKGV